MLIFDVFVVPGVQLTSQHFRWLFLFFLIIFGFGRETNDKPVKISVWKSFRLKSIDKRINYWALRYYFGGAFVELSTFTLGFVCSNSYITLISVNLCLIRRQNGIKMLGLQSLVLLFTGNSSIRSIFSLWSIWTTKNRIGSNKMSHKKPAW